MLSFASLSLHWFDEIVSADWAASSRLVDRPSGPPGSAADWWASQAPHSIWHKFCLFLPPEFYRDPRRNQYIALLGENFPV